MNKQTTRYFEWISGEDAGKITTLNTIYKMDGEVFFEFDDGECCNMRYIAPMTNDVRELDEKFIVEIYDPTYSWEIETIGCKKYKDESTEEVFDIPTLEDVVQANGNSCDVANSSLGKKKLKIKKVCPFKLDLPKVEDYEITETVDEPMKMKDLAHESIPSEDCTVSPIIENEDKPVKVQELAKPKTFVENTDPVYILSKTCKKHPTEVSINLNIDLPNKSVFQMVSDEFENGADSFIDYIVNSIDMTVFSNALKEALISSYTETSEKE